jgi:CheY-like chemotaxis protein/tetratricopeptide (TPR) repeat protein
MDTGQSKHRLLIVDGDPKSLRVLEVSLKKAGFGVAAASNAAQALAAMAGTAPDMIISDTDLDGTDGFELCRQIKAKPEWTKIPFLFVSGRKAIEDKIRGLELGVDDYLTKPVYIKEIGIRVRTALQRAERERLESRRDTRTRFSGNLADIGVVDLVQTIELNRKSGIIHIADREGRRGAVFFRDGRVVDAEVGRLAGPEAMYRLFSWSEGHFEVEFKPIRRRDIIEVPTAALLMEGMRRLDEWTRLLETLPGLDKVVEVDYRVLADQLAELPDEVNGLLRLCDGTRSLLAVIDDSDFPDLEALTVASNLFAQHIVYVREPGSHNESEPTGELARWLEEGNALASKKTELGRTQPGTTAGRTLTGMGSGVPAPVSEDPESVRTFTGFSGSSSDTPTPDQKPDQAAPHRIPTRENTTLRLPAPAVSPASLASNLETSDRELNPSGTASAQSGTPELSDGLVSEGLPEFSAVPAVRPRKTGGLSNTLRGIPIPQEQGTSDWPSKSEVEAAALAEEQPCAPSGNSKATLIGRIGVELGNAEPANPPAGGKQGIASEGSAQTVEMPRQALAELTSSTSSMEAPSSAASGEAPTIASEETPDDQVPAAKSEHLKATFVMADRLQPARRGRAAPIAYSLGLLALAGLLVWQLRSNRPEQTPAMAVSPAKIEPVVFDSGIQDVEPAASAAVPDATPAMEPRPVAKPAVRLTASAEPSKRVEGQAPAENADPAAALDRCRKLGASSRTKPTLVLSACQAANQLDPNASDIMVILARVELDRGNAPEARSWAKKAVELKADLAEAYVYLGGAEQEAGNSSEAKAAYKKYLELAPTGRYARDLRAVLDNL